MIKSAWLLVGLVTEQTDLAPAIVQGFERVQHISVLGVTLTYNLTMTTHIDNNYYYWLHVHVFCIDCAPFVAMACRLLLCTLCSSLLQWPRLHTVYSPLVTLYIWLL